MKLALNIIWVVFGGLFLAIGYFVAALLSFILIVTIPFGLQSMKLGIFTLWPGKRKASSAILREGAG